MIDGRELKARVEEHLGAALAPTSSARPNSTPGGSWTCATNAPAANTAKTATATNTWSF